jgi:hypothetical protein
MTTDFSGLFNVHNGLTVDQIQSLLDENDVSLISFKPGIYRLTSSLHIRRNNITLEGNGAILIMEDHTNEPVISVGTRLAITDSDPEVHNVNISNLVLDGNRYKQDSESSKKDPWIRNNCLDIRKTNGLTVTNVHARNARSGGIVISWYSSNMIFTNVQCYGNHFDGFAGYTAHSTILNNFIIHSNDGAGISLDNDFRDSIFNNGVVRNSQDVGIFMRDCYNLTFNAVLIFNNKSHGIFLGDNYDRHVGPESIHFSGCTIRGSGNIGVYNSALQHGKRLSMQACVLGPANANGNTNESFKNFTKSNDNVQYIR